MYINNINTLRQKNMGVKSIDIAVMGVCIAVEPSLYCKRVICKLIKEDRMKKEITLYSYKLSHNFAVHEKFAPYGCPSYTKLQIYQMWYIHYRSAVFEMFIIIHMAIQQDCKENCQQH